MPARPVTRLANPLTLLDRLSTLPLSESTGPAALDMTAANGPMRAPSVTNNEAMLATALPSLTLLLLRDGAAEHRGDAQGHVLQLLRGLPLPVPPLGEVRHEVAGPELAL